MGKNTIRLNESELINIIESACYEALKEQELDEGFFDNVKAGIRGAKQGFNAQRNLDASTDNLKYEHDYEDFRRESNPFMGKSQNTAQEQANELFQQAKYYRTLANQLQAKAQKISMQYGLEKSAVGQRVNPTPTTQPAAHNSTITQAKSTPKSYGRTRKQNNVTPIGQTGLWNA